MATRPTMAALIGIVQGMAGDKTPPLHFSADDIQRFLDNNRRLVRYQALECLPDYGPGGTTLYLTFKACQGHFEAGASLVDGSYNPLTPETADLINGEWTFAATQSNGVLVTGAVYDVYGAAADALEEWAADLSRSYDIGDGVQKLSRSQSPKGLREQAARYRALQPVKSVGMERSDVRRG